MNVAVVLAAEVVRVGSRLQPPLELWLLLLPSFSRIALRTVFLLRHWRCRMGWAH